MNKCKCNVNDDVKFNEDWVNTLNETDDAEKEAYNEDETVEESDEENSPEEQPEEDLTYIKGENGLLSDTSLQLVDLGSEIIDQHFQDILNTVFPTD